MGIYWGSQLTLRTTVTTTMMISPFTPLLDCQFFFLYLFWADWYFSPLSLNFFIFCLYSTLHFLSLCLSVFSSLLCISFLSLSISRSHCTFFLSLHLSISISIFLYLSLHVFLPLQFIAYVAFIFGIRFSLEFLHHLCNFVSLIVTLTKLTKLL